MADISVETASVFNNEAVSELRSSVAGLGIDSKECWLGPHSGIVRRFVAVAYDLLQPCNVCCRRLAGAVGAKICGLEVACACSRQIAALKIEAVWPGLAEGTLQRRPLQCPRPRVNLLLMFESHIRMKSVLQPTG